MYHCVAVAHLRRCSSFLKRLVLSRSSKSSGWVHPAVQSRKTTLTLVEPYFTMSSSSTTFATTFEYEPLQSGRHIRLLEIKYCETECQGSRKPRYSLVQYELPFSGTHIDFEAASYTWGDPGRISALHIYDERGQIGLTANLTEALPHMADRSRTKHLWIDQLCINQADNEERSAQVSLMSEIYKKAARVIVWLGPGDEDTSICKYVTPAYANKTTTDFLY
jgi:hypothetical protein